MHILIYKERGRSYRDLPMRLAENGTVYRNELSGALHGLTRVRGFTQDDSHLFVTPEQLEEETTKVLDFVISMLRDFGLDDFELELSMRDDQSDKWIGSDEFWDVLHERAAQRRPRERAQAHRDAGRSRVLRPEDRPQDARRDRPHLAALDRAGRPNLPERFELEYTDRDGHEAAADHDPPRAVRLDRAVLRDPPRALRRARSRSGSRRCRSSASRSPTSTPTTSATIIDAAAADGRARRARHERRPHAEEDPHAHDRRRCRSSSSPASRTAPASTVSFRFRDGTQENGVPIDDAVARIRERDRRPHARSTTRDDLST